MILIKAKCLCAEVYYRSFLKQYDLWGAHIWSWWVHIVPVRIRWSKLTNMRSELKVSLEVWAKRKSTVAQFADSFNQDEGRDVSKYTVYLSLLYMGLCIYRPEYTYKIIFIVKSIFKKYLYVRNEPYMIQWVLAGMSDWLILWHVSPSGVILYWAVLVHFYIFCGVISWEFFMHTTTWYQVFPIQIICLQLYGFK